jgi:hypothetical protein
VARSLVPCSSSRSCFWVPAALALGYFATCAVIGISGLVLFGDAEGAVSTVGRVISITVGGLLIVFAIPVVVLIGFYAAALQHASTVLGSLRTWMGKHNRAITVAIYFVFGAFFLVRGLLAG